MLFRSNMKIKCDWCGSWINDFDQVCPNCGGVNNNYNRHANGVPQTIEELKAWAKEMNLPLEDMRTFIGEDYKGAKAFGIYKDETDGTFVVYKNKEDGTRAVRYKGTDEAYAVNELYQKMKERVAVQKAHQQPKAAAPASRPTKDYTAYNKKRARQVEKGRKQGAENGLGAARTKSKSTSPRRVRPLKRPAVSRKILPQF